MTSSLKTRFTGFLAGKGCKFTGHRAHVVDVALNKYGTFTHDDIVRDVRGEVGRASVYRTLALMVEADVLRLVRFNGREVFVATASDT